jgi:radical SAM protein with 4Fe4S-binding SPASM domain
MKPKYDQNQLQHLRRSKGVEHHHFGDLLRPDAITFPTPVFAIDFTEENPYYFHLSVTSKCNARCSGCINSCVTNQDSGTLPFSDAEPERDARAIHNMITAVAADTAVICLYGGEPLMVPEKLNAFIETLDALHKKNGPPLRYMLYTNGQLLARAVSCIPKTLQKIWLYSVSIDGSHDQHDRIRLGTSLAGIEQNLHQLAGIRQGTVLMWSTLREEQSLLDCYLEFRKLQGKGLVDQFFWHWVEKPEPFTDLSAYMTGYEKDLHCIMADYAAALKAGEILPITHINELVIYLLTGKDRGSSACGVELAQNYDILGGKVHCCADLPPELAIGHIDAAGIPHLEKRDLSTLVAYKDDLGCYSCGIHRYCSGRCPVQALTSQAERLLQYCQLIRLHVGIVQLYLSDIVANIRAGSVTMKDIYEKSAFFNQFTDITP